MFILIPDEIVKKHLEINFVGEDIYNFIVCWQFVTIGENLKQTFTWNFTLHGESGTSKGNSLNF